MTRNAAPPPPPNVPLSDEQKRQAQALASRLTPEQAMWLSGYFAGLAGRGQGAGAEPTAGAKPGIPLMILFGTESGNSEALAAQAQKLAKRQGFDATMADMFDLTPQDLETTKHLLVILSTWGEGDPPERAEPFYKALLDPGAPPLPSLTFGVLALGDTSYVDFCGAGKKVDARLEALGGTRLLPRADCDVDYEEKATAWITDAIAAFRELTGAGELSASVSAPAAWDGAFEAASYSRSNPFLAAVKERIVLNDTGSAKETWHVELSLSGSGIHYEPGDALGILPENDPQMVDELLSATGLTGSETVNGGKSLKEALSHDYEITTLTRPLAEQYAALTGSKKVGALADPDAFERYANGREIIDLLTDHPHTDWDAGRLTGLLRKLPPRLYSIASSQASVGDEVHLTIAAVRYHTYGRSRKGVASTYLADQVTRDAQVKIYVKPNKHFRLPGDPATPVIMIGPGTGVAPFRAFLQQREAEGAGGRNWLFFGDQHYLFDFLYQIEWQQYLKDSLLTRLDVAFSRDAPEKCYVQHKMWDQRKALYGWLEEGAHLYVCGDEKRMSKDVDAMLHAIVSDQGGVSADQAHAYVARLKKEERYRRDVY